MSPARRRNHHRTPWRPPITHADVDTLAEHLTAELAQHAGAPDEISAVLTRWLDDQGTERLAFISLAVVRDVFAHHLTRVPSHDVPPGAFVLKEGTQP